MCFRPYAAANFYQRALLANALTSALRLHQRLPRFQLSRAFLTQALQEDSCHYLLYSLILVNSYPITSIFSHSNGCKVLRNNATYLYKITWWFKLRPPLHCWLYCCAIWGLFVNLGFPCISIWLHKCILCVWICLYRICLRIMLLHLGFQKWFSISHVSVNHLHHMVRITAVSCCERVILSCEVLNACFQWASSPSSSSRYFMQLPTQRKCLTWVWGLCSLLCMLQLL